MSGYVRNRYAQAVLDGMKLDPRYVFINYEKLIEVSEEIAQMDLGHNDWRGDVFPKEDDDRFMAFLVVSGAVNFCFTDFTTDKSFDVEYPAGKIQKGAFAMFAALMRAMEEGIDVLDPDVLWDLTQDEVNYVFRHAETPLPMLYWRKQHLNNLGRHFRNKRMSFADVFRKTGFKSIHTIGGGGIVSELARVGCYGDGNFLKRAQLVPMIYHGRALASSGALPLLEDPENIGPIADYRVPQALRHIGVIYYSKELAGLVDSGVHFTSTWGPHHLMELEIRAFGVVQAMDRLIIEVNRRRPSDAQIVMGQLDYPVWKMGRQAEGRHHYTYTTAY